MGKVEKGAIIKKKKYEGKKNQTFRYFKEQGERTEEFAIKTQNFKTRLNTEKPNEEPLGKVIQVALKEKPFGASYKGKRKFQGAKRPKISPKLIQKHSRGERADESGVKTLYFKEKLKRKEVCLQYANEQAARTEILLTENQGFIEPNIDQRTYDIRQKEIVKSVDITAAKKHFNLNLNFGPYHHSYTKNGRHLLLGGRRGHIAAFDWITKKLHCEFNIMEHIADIAWLHLETMFACAQKNWLYFYDNKGVEIHCIKQVYRANKLEFLPYHFLLAAGSREGFLSWLDVSIGELIGHYNSKLGDIRVMRQNPANGVLCIGGGKGVVTMWSPTVKEPLAKMLCHRAPINALAIDPNGVKLVTAGLESIVKVWDIRNLTGPLAEFQRNLPVNQIDVSQKGIMAVSSGKTCEMYMNEVPYLRQNFGSYVHCLRFCPFEDVLGVSTEKEFTSLLVPGAGEPNYDALEANPMQTKKQRREHEVHALLEKIPAELIALDPTEIATVDVNSLKSKIEAKKQILFVKPPQIDFTSRHKMKGKGGSANAAKNKKIVQEAARKEFIKEINAAKSKIIKEHREQNTEDLIPLEQFSALDRFKGKKSKINKS